jgi:hypothetical protein
MSSIPTAHLISFPPRPIKIYRDAQLRVSVIIYPVKFITELGTVIIYQPGV